MRVGLFTMVHLGSRRVPQKVLQPVGGKPLCQHIFESLAEAAKLEGVPAYCMACPGESPLAELAESAGLTVCPITQAAADSDDVDVVYANVRDDWSDRHDWMVFANACAPFLTVATIRRAVAFGRETAPQKWWSAREIPLPTLWRPDGTESLRDKINNTFRAEKWHLQSHVMRGLPPSDFTTERYASGVHLPFPINERELIDVDTPFDLETAQALALLRMDCWQRQRASSLAPNPEYAYCMD